MHDAIGLAILLAIAGALLVAISTGLVIVQLLCPDRRTTAWALARQLPSDPAERDIAFEEWWLDRAGARLPVWDMRLRPGDATAVVVHGWSESRVDALNRLASLYDPFDRVVLWDRRGHGDAEGRGARLGSPDCDDLVELLRRLEARDVTLIGHGTGSTIAARAAATDAGRSSVGRVVRADPAAFWPAFEARRRERDLPVWPALPLARIALAAVGIRAPTMPEPDERDTLLHAPCTQPSSPAREPKSSSR